MLKNTFAAVAAVALFTSSAAMAAEKADSGAKKGADSGVKKAGAEGGKTGGEAGKTSSPR